MGVGDNQKLSRTEAILFVYIVIGVSNIGLLYIIKIIEAKLNDESLNKSSLCKTSDF